MSRLSPASSLSEELRATAEARRARLLHEDAMHAMAQADAALLSSEPVSPFGVEHAHQQSDHSAEEEAEADAEAEADVTAPRAHRTASDDNEEEEDTPPALSRLHSKVERTDEDEGGEDADRAAAWAEAIAHMPHTRGSAGYKYTHTEEHSEQTFTITTTTRTQPHWQQQQQQQQQQAPHELDDSVRHGDASQSEEEEDPLALRHELDDEEAEERSARPIVGARGARPSHSTPISPAAGITDSGNPFRQADVSGSHQRQQQQSQHEPPALSAPTSPQHQYDSAEEEKQAAREPAVTVEDGPLHSREPSLAFQPKQYAASARPAPVAAQPAAPAAPEQLSGLDAVEARGRQSSAATSSHSSRAASSATSPHSGGIAAPIRQRASSNASASSASSGGALLPSPSPDTLAAMAGALPRSRPAGGAVSGPGSVPPHDFSSSQSYTDSLEFGGGVHALSLRQASSRAVEEGASDSDPLYREEEEQARVMRHHHALHHHTAAAAAQREANARALAASDAADADLDLEETERAGSSGRMSASEFDLLQTRDLAEQQQQQQQGTSAGRSHESAYRGRLHEPNQSLTLSDSSRSPSPSPRRSGRQADDGNSLGLIQSSLAATGAATGGLDGSWQRLGGPPGASSQSSSSGALMPSPLFAPTIMSASAAESALAYSAAARSQALTGALSSSSVSTSTAEQLVQLLIQKENEIYDQSRRMRELALRNAQRNQETAALIWSLERSKLEYNAMLADVRTLSASATDSAPPIQRLDSLAARTHRRGRLSQDYPASSVDVSRGARAISDRQQDEYFGSLRAQTGGMTPRIEEEGQTAGGKGTAAASERNSRALSRASSTGSAHSASLQLPRGSAPSTEGTASGSLQTPLPQLHPPRPINTSLKPEWRRSASAGKGAGAAEGAAESPDTGSIYASESSSAMDDARDSGVPSQIHSARDLRPGGASSKPSFVPPLNIPVVSLPMSAPPTSRDGAAEEPLSSRRAAPRPAAAGAASPSSKPSVAGAHRSTSLSAVTGSSAPSTERSQIWADDSDSNSNSDAEEADARARGQKPGGRAGAREPVAEEDARAGSQGDETEEPEEAESLTITDEFIRNHKRASETATASTGAGMGVGAGGGASGRAEDEPDETDASRGEHGPAAQSHPAQPLSPKEPPVWPGSTDETSTAPHPQASAQQGSKAGPYVHRHAPAPVAAEGGEVAGGRRSAEELETDARDEHYSHVIEELQSRSPQPLESRAQHQQHSRQPQRQAHGQAQTQAQSQAQMQSQSQTTQAQAEHGQNRGHGAAPAQQSEKVSRSQHRSRTGHPAPQQQAPQGQLQSSAYATAPVSVDAQRHDSRAFVQQQWAELDRTQQQQRSAAAAQSAWDDDQVSQVSAASAYQQPPQPDRSQGPDGCTFLAVDAADVAALPTDVKTLQAELLAARHDAERMRGLVLRLKSDRVKLKSKVAILKEKLAYERSVNGSAEAGSRPAGAGAGAHGHRGVSPTPSTSSSASGAGAGSGGSSKREMQRLASDMYELKQRFSEEAQQWRRQRHGMEEEIRRLSSQQQQQQQQGGGGGGAASSVGAGSQRKMGLDDLHSDQHEHKYAHAPPMSQSARRQGRAREPIIHILPNSSLDDGSIGGGAAAAASLSPSPSRRSAGSAIGGPARSERDYLSSLSPAHAHSHARLEQSHGRPRSRSASGGRYAQVGPRIRSNELNQAMLHPAAGIDERAQEEHRRREEQRRRKINEKRRQQQEEADAAAAARRDAERLQRQRAEFEQYDELLRHEPALVDGDAGGDFSQAALLHASAAEGYDRRGGPQSLWSSRRGWSLEREVAWQNDRAEVARRDAKDAHVLVEKRATAGVSSDASRRHLSLSPSPSPSRSQHRFIREEVRQQERDRLFQKRFGES